VNVVVPQPEVVTAVLPLCDQAGRLSVMTFFVNSGALHTNAKRMLVNAPVIG